MLVLQILCVVGLVDLLVLHKHFAWLRNAWFDLPPPKRTDPAWLSVLALVLSVEEWFRTNLFKCSMCLGFWFGFLLALFEVFSPVPAGLDIVRFGLLMGGVSSFASYLTYVVVKFLGAP